MDYHMGACKRELGSIVDGGSLDPGGDAHTMTVHFCEVLSAGDLDQLQAALEKELSAGKEHVPTSHKHFRALAVLEQSLKVLTARKKLPCSVNLDLTARS
jgi:hypothetical protein